MEEVPHVTVGGLDVLVIRLPHHHLKLDAISDQLHDPCIPKTV